MPERAADRGRSEGPDPGISAGDRVAITVRPPWQQMLAAHQVDGAAGVCAQNLVEADHRAIWNVRQFHLGVRCQPLAVKVGVDRRKRRRLAQMLASLPRGPEAHRSVAPARKARSMACGERGGLIEEKQLGVVA